MHIYTRIVNYIGSLVPKLTMLYGEVTTLATYFVCWYAFTYLLLAGFLAFVMTVVHYNNRRQKTEVHCAITYMEILGRPNN